MGSRAASKKHYANNKAQYRERYRRRAESFRQIVRAAKARPCMDCGVQYPHFVMEFDHRDPNMKSFTISKLGFASSEKRLREEIEKCDVVCANCHRIRHGSVA